MSDDLFRVIALELQTRRLDPALWARAFAECDGDEARTKAQYIRLRHAELADTTTAPAAISATSPPPAPPATASWRREMLANGLAKYGINSFYPLLGLTARCTDAELGAVLQALDARINAGETLDAELRYAMEALATPELRERYDQRLQELVQQAEAPTPTPAPAGHGATLRRSPWLAGLGALAATAMLTHWLVVPSPVKTPPTPAAPPEATTTQISEAETSREQIEERTRQIYARRETEHLLHMQTARQRDEEYQARQRALTEDAQRRQAAARLAAETQQRDYEAQRLRNEARRDACRDAQQRNNYGEIQRWCY